MDGLKHTDISRLPQSCIIAGAAPEDTLHEAALIAAAAVCSGDEPPCGVCRDCRKALSGIHPDIIRVSRPVDGSGKQKREISVDQIRSIAADAVVLPNEAKRKVYIIDEADSMNLSAQNAALKLLEEPPAGAMLLLCATNPDRLLPTVRSRCAELSVNGKAPTSDEGAMKLAEEYIRLAAKGDAAALCRWCGQNDGMDSASAEAMLSCVQLLLSDMLCLRREPVLPDRGELMRLADLAGRCCAWLRGSVGVKHIFGLLAVDTLPQTGNRGKTVD